MSQLIEELNISTAEDKFINITDQIFDILAKFKLKNGLLNLTILHTSASLMIQENADPTVLKDIQQYLDKIVPEGNYFHNTEGPDDMPAHIRTALTQTHLSIPIQNNVLQIGQWQGIFLYEHRLSAHNRSIATHIIGD